MLFSIITPSYGQLDWLRLCIASIADQVSTGEKAKKLTFGKADKGDSEYGSPVSRSTPLRVEHIIQDGGTPGIEEFSIEVGNDLKLRYGGDFVQELQTFELLHFRTEYGYSLRVFKEPDSGMYDAINKGIARMRGDLWAWLNCDEQYLPGTLNYVAGWFSAHPKVGILFGDAVLTDGDGNALSYRRIVAPWKYHTRLVHLSSLSCASFYRRSILDRGGVFDTTWRSIGDAVWISKMIRARVVRKSCNRLLSTFAFTGRNTSESPLALEEGMRWRQSADAPPQWLAYLLVCKHRVRKFLAGAYAFRSLNYSIYKKGSAGRVVMSINHVGWLWPSLEETGGGKGKEVEGKRDDETGLEEISILGTSLLVTSYDDLANRLVAHVRDRSSPLAVDFANTHVVTMRCHELEFAQLTECIDLTVPDGMPLVWVMNLKGASLRDRVYGPTFTRNFFANCPPGLTHFLVGGSTECGELFRERMLTLNPSLNFVGGYHGKCSEDGVLEDDDAVFAEIEEKKPDFIWVGLGTPKQYEWIHRVKPHLDEGVMLAVGFAFDVNASMKQDAPAWMQPLGLTWFHRLVSEPRRLMWRYLKWNTLFLFYLAWEWIEGGKWIVRSRQLKKWKLLLRHHALRVIDLFASEIIDCDTGESLGRGMVIGWGGVSRVIGHPGLPPLIPKFLPQKRLTYWNQKMGFTTHPAPNFAKLDGAVFSEPESGNPKVINILITHEAGEKFEKLKKWWSGICPEENLWVAFGGTRDDFESLHYPRKIYVDDPRLRKTDNQREKQCYTGIFRAMAGVVQAEGADYVYLCEYDQLPMVADLNERQVAAILHEGADVLGHWLYRVDGTGHYHELYHEADPDYLRFWRSFSRRHNPAVILSMFGSGSFWSREAFLAVAAQKQSIECYLEIYLPTLAHHLGFRVRGWNESNHLLSNLPSPLISFDEAKKKNCWTVHPVKEISARS